MLVYKNDTSVEWKGEPINGIRHSRDIETKWTTQELSDIGLEVSTPSVSESLSDAKIRLKAMVDFLAENYRMNFITAGFGQSLTYDEKRKQAEEVLGLGETAANALSEADGISQYPTLYASVGKEGATLFDCAKVVNTQVSQWKALSYTIENKRLQAKIDIDKITDIAAGETIVSSINWSS